MPCDGRVEIRIVWMPHNKMPSPFDNRKSVCPIQAPKVVLLPSKGRLLHVREEVLTSGHRASLAHPRKGMPPRGRGCGSYFTILLQVASWPVSGLLCRNPWRTSCKSQFRIPSTGSNGGEQLLRVGFTGNCPLKHKARKFLNQLRNFTCQQLMPGFRPASGRVGLPFCASRRSHGHGSGGSILRSSDHETGYDG